MGQIPQHLVSESILGNSQVSQEPENGDRNQLKIKKEKILGYIIDLSTVLVAEHQQQLIK